MVTSNSGKELSAFEILFLFVIITAMTFVNLYLVGNILNIFLTIIQVLYVLSLIVKKEYQDALLWHNIFVLTSVSGTNTVGIESIDSELIYNYARLKIVGPVGLSYCVTLFLFIISLSQKGQMPSRFMYFKLFKLLLFASISGFVIGAFGLVFDDYKFEGWLNYGIYIIMVLVNMKCLMNFYSFAFLQKLSRFLEIVLSGALFAIVINYLAGGVTTTYGGIDNILLTPDLFNYGMILLFCFFAPHNKHALSKLIIFVGLVSFAYTNLTTSYGKVLISILLGVITFIFILLSSHSFSKKTKFVALTFLVLVAFITPQMSFGDLSEQKSMQVASMVSGDASEVAESPMVRIGEVLNLAYEGLYNPIYLVFGHGYGGYFKDDLSMFSGLMLGAAFSDKDISSGHYHSAHDTFSSVPLNNGFIVLVILLYISFYYLKRTKYDPYSYAAISWLALTFYFNIQIATCGLLFLYASELNQNYVGNRKKKIVC